MARKNSSKTPMKVRESSSVEEEKPSSVQKKKLGSEIDDIFAGKKRKKSEKGNPEKPNQDGSDKSGKKKKRKPSEQTSKDDGFAQQPSRPRKRTADGLAVYTEEELGINKTDAGGTPLCPFDCSCCF